MTTAVNYVWKPSSARVVVIDSFVPVPRGATAVAPAPLSWPTKDPQDILDYQLDIGPAVVGNIADTIAGLGVSVTPNSPGDLVVNSSAVDGTRAILWLGGGRAGTVYTITLLMTTINGRTIQRSILLPVLELSVSPLPANAIQTSIGTVLTDQNGNPVLSSP
jgi:hypothetical protein